jgi:sulfane dehydrogenase subunit SoxC
MMAKGAMTMSQQTKTPPSRRGFLTAAAAGGVVAATGGVAAAREPDKAITELPDWSRMLGDGVADRPYGKPSKFEAHVIRRDVEWLTASRQSSVNFTPLHELDGIITPNGLCFERHHAGIAEIDPARYRLMINGMVERELVFTIEDLKRFPRVNKVHFLECAANSGMEWRGAQLNGCQFTHGMVHNVMYTGVPLKHLLNEAGVRVNASWVMAEGADASGMNRSIPLAKCLDDCLVAYRMNGEMLRPEQGYPVRLVVPGWEGNMWVKWIRRIAVYDQAVESREETSKYTDMMPDGRARKWTWVMDAKSVITSPSPQAPIRHGKGPLVITGLAWSGHGRITRVDVSTDGGNTWTPARLTGDVKSKALTRFHHDISWDGSEMFILSRATDETGYVQPTKQALRDIRGLNNVYHNNAIQTWWVRADGEVENVEIA